jgi:pyrimidine operon attenuation protein/uracil phosphoribosyltransferase
MERDVRRTTSPLRLTSTATRPNLPAHMGVAGTREVLLDARGVQRALHRMAKEIVELASDHMGSGLVLVGIQRRGVGLAERLGRRIEETERVVVLRGALDITLYRDDLQTIGPRPVVGETHLPVDLDGRSVVIVDDVLYTGRTVRAALDELADFGRPARIGLAVLIDRGGRELPIQADVVGKRAKAGPGDRVEVLLKEVDGREGVELVGGEAP